MLDKERKKFMFYGYIPTNEALVLIGVVAIQIAVCGLIVKVSENGKHSK